MKQKGIRLFLICLGVVFLAGLCAACQRGRDREETTLDGELKEGTYRVYTINKAGTKLSAYNYTCEATETESIVGELLEQVKMASGALEQNSAMPENLYLQSFTLTDKILYLYFDGNYLNMRPTVEVLCRAALAKTLTQVEGVDYISVYVNDQPLIDSAGSQNGYVTGSDFIERVSDVEDMAASQTITLYFTDETGTKLLPEIREVTVPAQGISIEHLVVSEILSGPKEEGHYPSLPSTVKINGVQIRNQICYVNLNGAFLNDALDVSEYIPVYSLVNSLAELSTVSKVQIMVDGNSSIVFRDSLSLENPLERQLDYVAQ
ncbi:MAG: GerMN domain-containing protein [Lachnospiraceae bacterium]|nr:GerMN domain-containing protein [Lachnospiraceae bacterium]